MKFEFAVLASGSRANCVYVSDGKTRLLVDCGLSARETERRLFALGVSPESIDAIVITHEHSDHVAGLPVFARRYSRPVFLNEGTLEGAAHYLEQMNVERFLTGYPFEVGTICIEPFSIMHDANDPVGLRLTAGGHALGIVTDLGQVTTLVRERTRDLSALVLESNHDWDLLQAAPYPWELKQRIAGRNGHLRNEEACSLLEDIAGTLRVLVGAHISEKANHPELVIDGFTEVCRKNGYTPEIAAASARVATKLYVINGDELPATAL